MEHSTRQPHAFLLLMATLCLALPIEAQHQEWAARRQRGAHTKAPRYDFPPPPDRCHTPKRLGEHVRCVSQLPDSLKAELWWKKCLFEKNVDYTKDSWDIMFRIRPGGSVDSIKTTYTTIGDFELKDAFTKIVDSWTFYAEDIPPEGVTVHLRMEFENRRRRRIVGIGIGTCVSALVYLFFQLLLW